MKAFLNLLRPGSRQAAEWEVEHHVQERADRLVDEGWEPEAARQEAERLFGDRNRLLGELVDIGKTTEGRRTMMDVLDTLRQDLRYALRGARRNPAMTLALVLTLGLGIGATTAAFAVVDALLLRPLPYRDAERLVDVSLDLGEFALPFLFEDQQEPWREAADFLDEFALHEHVDLVRTDGPEAEAVDAMAVSHDLDDLLGVEPWLGRGFAPDDAMDPDVVLLAHGYWRRMGGPPNVLGRDLVLDGRPYRIVGVLPSAFKFPVAGSSDMWIPIAADGTAAHRPLPRAGVVGRLRDAFDLESAQARADHLAEVLQEETPQDRGWKVKLSGVGDWRANPDVIRSLWMFLGTTAGMLLIALVNGVNLLLARGSGRAHEMGVRTSIGASRGRVFRQLLTESVVVALLAGAVATVAAAAAVPALGALLPQDISFSSVYAFTVETRVLVFTFLTALVCGTVLGILPAFQARKEGEAAARSLGPRAAGGRRRHRVQDVLIVTEVALSVALLVGAGLFARSFTRLVRVDPGFQPDGLLYMDISLSRHRYASGPERRAFFGTLEDRIERIPGVTGVTVARGMPPRSGFSFGEALQADGREPPASDQPFLLPRADIRPDYLDVLGIRLVAGRSLTPEDHGTRHVLVDRSLARFLWGEEAPVGRRFRLGEDDDWLTVAGVVEELRLRGADDRQGGYDVLYALPDTTMPDYGDVAVRTTGDPRDLMPAIRRAVTELDPEQPIASLQTARAALGDSLRTPRFLTAVMLLLAGVAAALAALGIHGVLSYSVSLRAREMGIRIALGASVRRVRTRIVAGGVALATLGIALGLGLASLLDSLVRSLLFGIEPGDPLTRVGVGVVMLLVSWAACWMPARRATGVNPVEVLNAE